MGSGSDGVEDRALAEEIVLLGELMAAAAEQAQHLSDARVDEVLGVTRSGPPGDWAGPPEDWSGPPENCAGPPDGRPGPSDGGERAS